MKAVIFTFLIWAGTIFSGEIIMRVDGLACAFCAYGLEKKLKRLEGVEEVRISLNEGRVWIRFKEGYSINEQTLRRLVKESGFVLREIIIK